MEFTFGIGTKAVFGANCVKNNKQEFAIRGKRCIIVTGKSSGKTSGALEDVTHVLKELGIEYIIFDGAQNNPSLDNVKEGGDMAAKDGVDFVIGIGGGSPLDVSKAVAVLAVNQIEPVDLFKNEYEKEPLPIIAIPTTAGTGSEVTPYSILTRDDIKTKKSFANDSLFPKVAFLDAKYTETMPYHVTIDTAIDALSHAVEGYLSIRSTPISDIFAVEAIRLFGQCINGLLEDNIDITLREKLLYMSFLAGMVIAHTGTTIVHSLGYPLTYYKGVSHGRANGFLMEEYLNYNYDVARDKIDNILRLMNLGDRNEFGKVMDRLLNEEISLDDDEFSLYASTAIQQKSIAYNLKPVEKEDLEDILKRTFK